jgi:hypothetical protein
MPAGGARPGAGRKSKAEELKLIEKLSPLEGKALKLLQDGLDNGEFAYLKLYFEYFYGKPTETIDVEHSGGMDNKVELDVSKLSDDTIRHLLDARRGKDPDK